MKYLIASIREKKYSPGKGKFYFMTKTFLPGFWGVTDNVNEASTFNSYEDAQTTINQIDPEIRSEFFVEQAIHVN